MAVETPRTMNHGLDEWTREANALDYIELGKALEEDKAATLRLMESLGLPQFKHIECPTSAFNKDAGGDGSPYFDQLDSTTYYVTVLPNDPSRDRDREVCPNREMVLAFVTGTLDIDSTLHSGGYDRMILMETAKMEYGANIVIGDGPENPIYIEAVQGTHSDLVGSREPLVLSMHRSIETGSLMRFKRHNDPDADRGEKIALNHDEVLIRRALFGALMSIPHTSVEQDHSPEFALSEMKFRPGYYELCLIESSHGPWLEPRFIDCSDNPLFVPTRTF